MKTFTAVLILLISLIAVFHRASASLRATATSRPETSLPPPTPRAVCNNNALQQLWAHVYNPQRLVVRHACVHATGTIVLRRSEPDGDIHILVKMDPRYQNLVAPGNSREGGNLVVEPICTHKVTQPNAVAACAGFSFPVSVFPVGTHVGIRGPLVFDRHHGWSEIHPLEKMVRLP